jgi:hypothetical protein
MHNIHVFGQEQSRSAFGYAAGVGGVAATHVGAASFCYGIQYQREEFRIRTLCYRHSK